MNANFADTQPDLTAAMRRRARRWMPSNTLVLCLVMLATTASAAWLSPNWLVHDNSAMLRLGGNVPQATLDHFGFWRILAAKLQLGSWLGAALFLPFWWLVSRAFETTYGRALHLLVFVAASAMSSTATIYFQHNEKLMSVGGGGPALAMAFCLLAAILRRRAGAPALASLVSWRLSLALPYLALVSYSLARGAGDPSSLLTGMAAGMCAGLILATSSQPGGARHPLRLAAAGLAALTLVTAGLVFAPRPTYYLSEHRAFLAWATDYPPEFDALNARFDALTARGLSGELSRRQLGEGMGSDVVAGWQRTQAKAATVLMNRAVPDGEKLADIQEYAARRLMFLRATARAWETDEAEPLVEAARHKEALEKARIAMATPSK